MTMIETDTLALCECCALLIANGDESGCRDYYGHTHQSADAPAHTVLSDETDQPCHGFTCDGCGERQDAYAYRLWAVVLEQKHTHAYDAERADWWCFDCSTVTDYCDQI
jgi:hypothetical protein